MSSFITFDTGDSTFEKWQILFHETMAAVLRSKEAVKKQFGLVGVLNGLWRSARDMKTLTESLKALSELPDGIVNNEFIESQIPQLRELLSAVGELLDTARSRGMTNRSLSSTPLGLIGSRSQYICDYLETLEMSIDPEVVNAINEGRSQIEHGDYELMERLL